eukprot:Hpha_TRINITY_DN1626_c0_g1::TRINITY_DN1626_c0_g1_i1::g.48832::m.48832
MRLGEVKADFYYLKPEPGEATNLVYSQDKRDSIIQGVTMGVKDARSAFGVCADNESVHEHLRRRGFAVLNFESSVQGSVHRIENTEVYLQREKEEGESEESARIRDSYFRDCERRVKAATGAKHVFVVDYTVRNGPEAAENKDMNFLTRYARIAHGDYADGSVKRVLEMLRRRGIAADEGSVSLINLWQPTCPLVESYPLAMLDPSTAAEVHPVRVGYKLRSHDENFIPPWDIVMPGHSPRHSWWYYPEMRAGEALLLTQLDLRPGMTRRVIHSSFFHPDQRGKPRRTSIEVRFACVYGAGSKL